MKHFRTVTKNRVAQPDKKYCRLGVLVYVLFFVLMIVTLSCKEYYFTDEIYSHILANRICKNIVFKNNSTQIVYSVPYLTIYKPAEGYLNIHFGVNPHRQLDYKQVIKNQAQDTHPPLYYILLHTLCSFCPGVFSKWFAGIINIIFALLTLFVLRKLICHFTDDKSILTAISYTFAFSSTILNSVACLRMYIMAMFWVTLCTYILIRYARRDLSKSFYASIFAVTTLGTLTHYHCALYFALSYVIFVAFLFYPRL